MRPSSTLLFLLAPASLIAQSVVVPNANATVSGTSGLNTIVRDSGQARTYMMGINAAELTGIPVGDVIVGLSFRQWSGGTVVWPPTDATWADYEISIGPSISPAAFTATFASNFTGTPTLARDGAMLLPANTFPVTTTPRPFGEFYFDLQTPVPYTGGDLGILMTHPGSSLTTNCFLDVVASNAGTHGVAFSATTFQAASGAAATFYVTRIHYGYGAGCPGTGGATPVLVQNGDTTGGAGGTIMLSVANAPANQPALISVGFGRISAPLPNGCNLLITPLANSLIILDANGRGSQSINIPAAVTGTFNAQAFVLDAGAPGGFTTTNGVQPSAF